MSESSSHDGITSVASDGSNRYLTNNDFVSIDMETLTVHDAMQRIIDRKFCENLADREIPRPGQKSISKGKKFFSCLLCAYISPHKATMRRHMKRQDHEERTLFYCEDFYCPGACATHEGYFFSFAELAVHLLENDIVARDQAYANGDHERAHSYEHCIQALLTAMPTAVYQGAA
ncbi:unnamed protein product [Cyclocybe aegerita]|uniref:Uncharacterized protein n=1 Tax=Cyclocybe aegerita TaxID=1973307 RepID=A0A8S0W1S0_CYCAE|nr:unnamed protein product [Cyclocybe aegerita]